MQKGEPQNGCFLRKQSTPNFSEKQKFFTYVCVWGGKKIYGFCLHYFRTVDSLNQSHNEKEKCKLDADLQLNNLRFKLDQEMDARAMAERLCNQLKDQLGRCEKKLTR